MSTQHPPECCEVLVNGRPSFTLSLFDRSIHYGDGLFETIALVDGKPQFLKHHMKRLQKGAERLKISFKDYELLEKEIQQIIGERKKGVLKIILSRGAGGRGYAQPVPVEVQRIVYCYPWPLQYDELNGLKVRFCDTTVSSSKQLQGIKHLNRLENVLARSEWDDEFHEGLMADMDGNWIEGTMCNLFWVSGGVIYTPLLQYSGIEGIIRQQVFEMAQEIGTTCKPVVCSEKETLLNADEIFLTNSVMGIKPVVELDGKHFAIGSITKQLQQQLQIRIA